ncbi:helix-turn-helix transcriptional regulator [Streptomyces sp. SID10815]|uniref:helix-turn-helix domain-containing protein n=1 Tax=Streptomyces sp. SID10815 TaxID=2706027 RepID=UPI0013CAD24F|nr:helix-turn-helix transcriptional regulator [Streptomyces sp. SID10815]NEA52340.1 helix-turn-helix transcriptional regulator [Streptomyces sp. SID10815]
MEATPTTVKVNGAEIRKLRIQAGLSTTELAKEARLSARYLNHLENGYRTRMRPHSHSRLRQALGLPADSTQLLAPSEEQPETR